MAGSASPDDFVPVDIGGTIVNVPPSQVAALVGGTFVTPQSTFSFSWNGVILNFNNGDPVEVEPALQAALIAAGAPVV